MCNHPPTLQSRQGTQPPSTSQATKWNQNQPTNQSTSPSTSQATEPPNKTHTSQATKPPSQTNKQTNQPTNQLPFQVYISTNTANYSSYPKKKAILASSKKQHNCNNYDFGLKKRPASEFHPAIPKHQYTKSKQTLQENNSDMYFACI